MEFFNNEGARTGLFFGATSGVITTIGLIAGLHAGTNSVTAVLGGILTFATSWLLSRTVLRGEVSTFNLELPPYRPPRVLQTLYTSLIDRTIYVLWRAIVFAAHLRRKR